MTTVCHNADVTVCSTGASVMLYVYDTVVLHIRAVISN